MPNAVGSVYPERQNNISFISTSRDQTSTTSPTVSGVFQNSTSIPISRVGCHNLHPLDVELSLWGTLTLTLTLPNNKLIDQKRRTSSKQLPCCSYMANHRWLRHTTADRCIMNCRTTNGGCTVQSAEYVQSINYHLPYRVLRTECIQAGKDTNRVLPSLLRV